MKQDSNMAADSTLPECEEKEVGISDVQIAEGNVEELSTEHEGHDKEAVSSVVQEDSKMKEDFPAEQVDDMKEDVTEVGKTPDGKFDEKCIEEGPRKKKIVKVLKVKRKIIKKSPTSSVSRTKKAHVEQEGDKKEKEVLVAQEVGDALEAQKPEKEQEVLVAQEVGETLEAQNPKKEPEVPVAQEVGETREAQNPTETSNKPESKTNKINKVLKVKRKIVKKSPASSVSKTKKAQVEHEDGKKEKEVPVAQEVGETLQAQNSKKEKEALVAPKVGDTLEAPKPKEQTEVHVAQEVGETLEAQNPTETSSKPESKTKKINTVLKVKRKIVKKSPATSQMKTNKLESSPKVVQARKRQENNKSVLQECEEGSEKKVEDTEKPNQKENVSTSVSKVECSEKREETSASHKNKEEKNIEKKGGSSDKSIKNQKKKENDREQKGRREDRKKEHLGGLIFMCSAKTKPDCFHYNVMGVSAAKKDGVLAIKPGLTLFLYDFDLRLLYGIYKASSSGGLKLEPKAFNGAFPAQVRFNVHKDCIPLPESIFKKAIQENYYEKHKFKVELTAKQVRKLSDLFRPVGLHSSSATVRSHPEVPIRDRKVRGEVKDTQIRNSKSKGDVRNYHLSSHGRDQHREEASRHRERVPRDLYPSEKDYQTYGLRAERRNLDPVPRSSLETYHRGHDRDYQLRHLEPRYRDDVSAHSHREAVRADRVYFNGKDYPVYSVDSRSQISPSRATSASGLVHNAYDSIYTRQYGLHSTDPYLLPSRSVETAGPTYSRSYVTDTEPTRHAASTLSYYNQVHHKDVESDTMPVSSRYSFAGPSFSYR